MKGRLWKLIQKNLQTNGLNHGIHTISIEFYRTIVIILKLPLLWLKLHCKKKIWEVDPLLCPHCKSEMKIISFITDPPVINQILQHLNLFVRKPVRDPPVEPSLWHPVYEPYDDGWPLGYDEPCVVLNWAGCAFSCTFTTIGILGYPLDSCRYNVLCFRVSDDHHIFSAIQTLHFVAFKIKGLQKF